MSSYLTEKQETHVSEQLTDGETAAKTTEASEPASESTATGRPSKVQRLEHEGDIAADYLEELLDIADLDGDLDIDVEADRAAVSIVGAELSQLVGQDGKAEPRQLHTGAVVNGQWLVTAGLKAGDQLIVDGLQRLRPGAPVQAVVPAAAIAASATAAR